MGKWLSMILFITVGLVLILGAIGGIISKSQLAGFGDGVYICVFIVVGIGCYTVSYFIFKDKF